VIFALWFFTLVAIVIASLVLLTNVFHPFIYHRHGDPCHFAPLAYWCKSSSYLQMIFFFVHQPHCHLHCSVPFTCLFRYLFYLQVIFVFLFIIVMVIFVILFLLLVDLNPHLV